MQEFLIVDDNLRAAMRFFGDATGTGEVRALDRHGGHVFGARLWSVQYRLLTRPAGRTTRAWMRR